MLHAILDCTLATDIVPPDTRQMAHPGREGGLKFRDNLLLQRFEKATILFPYRELPVLDPIGYGGLQLSCSILSDQRLELGEIIAVFPWQISSPPGKP